MQITSFIKDIVMDIQSSNFTVKEIIYSKYSEPELAAKVLILALGKRYENDEREIISALNNIIEHCIMFYANKYNSDFVPISVIKAANNLRNVTFDDLIDDEIDEDEETRDVILEDPVKMCE